MIGVLAYGSLISDPGAELAAVIQSARVGILTPFSVEYARSSSGRKGAPTLVPVATGGARVRATIFEVTVGVDEAADIVYRREIGQIGTGRKYVATTDHSHNTVKIDQIPDFAGFETVISTRISANIFPLNADKLALLAIKSTNGSDVGKDGISYLMNAMQAGIVTPLTYAYEAAILAQTGAIDLASALASTRKG